MSAAHTVFSLTRHLYRVWHVGQLRFRLETFGLYYPSRPYETPFWRLQPRYALLLLRQLPAYARWVEEMEGLRTGGAQGWWSRYGWNGEGLPDDG